MVVGRVTYPTTMAASTLNYIKLNILEKQIGSKSFFLRELLNFQEYILFFFKNENFQNELIIWQTCVVAGNVDYYYDNVC